LVEEKTIEEREREGCGPTYLHVQLRVMAEGLKASAQAHHFLEAGIVSYDCAPVAEDIGDHGQCDDDRDSRVCQRELGI
jgi:hypothetical protein